MTLDLSSESDNKKTQAVTVIGANKDEASVTYSSSATGIATVTAKGEVTAVGIGVATITATDSVTESSATYTVRVVQKTATKDMFFDFRIGIVSNTAAAEEFDFGILKGTAKYHGSSYGLIGNPTVTFSVLGPSKIYFAQMDYGSEFTVRAGATELGKVTTEGTSINGDNKKCTKTVLAEAIAEGHVDSVTYTGSGPAEITVTGSQYLSRIWVTEYQE